MNTLPIQRLKAQTAARIKELDELLTRYDTLARERSDLQKVLEQLSGWEAEPVTEPERRQRRGSGTTQLIRDTLATAGTTGLAYEDVIKLCAGNNTDRRSAQTLISQLKTHGEITIATEHPNTIRLVTDDQIDA